MMCGGMMLLLIPGAISNSNAVIRQEFRKLRFQMIHGRLKGGTGSPERCTGRLREQPAEHVILFVLPVLPVIRD